VAIDNDFIKRGKDEKAKTEFAVSLYYAYYDSLGCGRLVVKLHPHDVSKLAKLVSGQAISPRPRFSAVMTAGNILVLTPDRKGYALSGHSIQFTTLSQLRIAEPAPGVSRKIDHAIMRWGAGGTWQISLPPDFVSYDPNGKPGTRLRDSVGRTAGSSNTEIPPTEVPDTEVPEVEVPHIHVPTYNMQQLELPFQPDTSRIPYPIALENVRVAKDLRLAALVNRLKSRVSIPPSSFGYTQHISIKNYTTICISCTELVRNSIFNCDISLSPDEVDIVHNAVTNYLTDMAKEEYRRRRMIEILDIRKEMYGI
jgi:hypothetical protein